MKVDRFLAARLRDAAAVRADERRVLAAARRTYAALTDDLLTWLRGHAYASLPPSGLACPGFIRALDRDLLPAIGDVYAREYDAVTTLQAAASLAAQANAEEYLRHVRNQMVRLPQAVFNQIRRALRLGVEAGEGVPELAARVDALLRAEGAENWPGRATTVARTETIRAFNSGRLGAGRVLTDLNAVPRREVQKRWLATNDARTRHTHTEADEQTVRLDSYFRVGGFLAAFPGAPALPARESINCRCTVLILLPGDPGYDASLVAAGGFNPNQKRIPKGQSGGGRWTTYLSGTQAVAAVQDAPNWTDADTHTAYLQAGSASNYEMNELLRTGSLYYGNEEKVQGNIDRVRELIDRTPGTTAPVQMWRGTQGEWAQRLQPGDEFTDRGFVSVTSDLSMAERFTGVGWTPPGQRRPPQGTVFRVRIDEGTPMLNEGRANVEAYIEEAGFALRDGSRFRVVGRQHESEFGREIVTVDLVPSTERSRTAAAAPGGEADRPENHSEEELRARRFLWLEDDIVIGRGEEDEATTAAAVIEPSPYKGETVTIEMDETTFAQELAGLPVPWHGVLAPEGVMSGDRRKFANGALRWRDLPLPLLYQEATEDGHGGSVRVGVIRGIQRADEGMRAWGTMDTGPNADEAIRQLATEMLRGVSVDVDDATFGFETTEGKPLKGDDLMPDTEPVMVVSDGRISGATLCSIPAFQEAYVSLGEPPADWGIDSRTLLAAYTPEQLRAVERQVVRPFGWSPREEFYRASQPRHPAGVSQGGQFRPAGGGSGGGGNGGHGGGVGGGVGTTQAAPYDPAKHTVTREEWDAASPHAIRVFDQASRNKDRVTGDVQGFVEANGGTMEGLAFRQKELGPLTEKIAMKARTNGTTAEAEAGKINDALRYTGVWGPDDYTASGRSTVAALREQGYTVTGKNTWGSTEDPYRGVNLKLTDRTGQRVELQFHTPDSFSLKMAEGPGTMHDLYRETQRAEAAGNVERARSLTQQQFALSGGLTEPRDARNWRPI